MRFLTFLLAFFGLSASLFSQSPNFFQDISENEIVLNQPRRIVPAAYRTMRVDLAGIRNWLAAAPHESLVNAGKSDGLPFLLPLADGRFELFEVWDAPIFEPGLAAQFPEMRSFSGKSVEKDGTTARFSLGPDGFHSMILSPTKGDIFLDPYAFGNLGECIVYTRDDFYRTCTKVFDCHFEDDSHHPSEPAAGGDRASDCGFLHTYRLALACTGEYAAYFGGTTAGALGGMTNSMTRINGVYEKELSVRMTLVSNNSSIIYLNAATDPFTNDDGGLMLGENQTTCDNFIGDANYDIGHVFSTGGGGVAYLGVPCSSGSKAGGVTGSGDPVGDPFDIDYVAHEMGHQFGANHTFYSNQGSCNGNQSNARAMEPGSGTTIMAYAGICGTAHNVQSNSHAYFHTVSLIEMGIEVLSNTCDAQTAVMNGAPVITSMTDATIPTATPIALTATASDPQSGDGLTYCWEQYNRRVTAASQATMPPLATNTDGPLFRSNLPQGTSTRYCPPLENVVAGTANTWEVSTSVNRRLLFRLTVRDNNPLGGCTTQFPAASLGATPPNSTAATTVAINLVTSAAAFSVSYPTATGISWPRGSAQTVTWTTGSPAATVDILLSTDGGASFPTVLLSGTANDGTHVVTIPISTSMNSTSRIMVRAAASGYYYDVSNNNFTVAQALPLELTAFSARLFEGKKARLDWQTALEDGLRGFFVERSAGAAFAFENIGFVESRGAGDYLFIDEKLEKGQTYYYRLRFDDEKTEPGASQFSPLRSVETGEKSRRLALEPNPADDRAFLKFDGEGADDYEPLEVELFSPAGQLLAAFSMDAQRLEIDLAGLPSGPFMVVARSARQVWTGRFLKN